MTTRWHYKVVEVKATWMTVKPKQIEEALAMLGAQGWELVSTSPYPTSVMLYLKKPG
ncbi:MAG: DUF4177 domain-containing protein [Xanthomonadales bacterium]|jgi:hypothetical protein|nr:DUF4177 domain-containing protein [Xanthomonadales bacterium]